jgi:hypothetical protein
LNLSEPEITDLIKRFGGVLDNLPKDLTNDQKTVLTLAVAAKLRNSRFLNLAFEGSQDKAAMQDSIDTILRQTLGSGHALTQHGINQTLSGKFNDARLTRVGEIISQFYEDLKANCGVECFITSGTLLGIVRSGKIIPHDDDFDLAYVSKFETNAEILSERREIHRFLSAHASYNNSTRERHFTLTSDADGRRFTFDLFPAWIKNGLFSEVPLKPEALPADAILPLKRLDFYGVPVPAPRNPEALLEINYGPGWRSPDPSFRFDFSQYAAHYWFLHEDFLKDDFNG